MKTKDILRYRLKQIRNNIIVEDKEKYQAQICRNIMDFCEVHNKTDIAGFYPNKDEINILPALKESGKASLPKIINGKMYFTDWNLEDKSLENEGRFLQPQSNIKVTPQIILVPCLGYDERGYRIGYGGGYYDKTLPKYNDSITIAVAYSAQKLIEVPKEEFDIAVDFIVTEKGIFQSS